MSTLTEKELLALKTKVDDAKTTLSTLKGKLQYVNQQLLEEWGCETVEDAFKKLKQLDREIAATTARIEKDTIALQDKYSDFLNQEQDDETT